MSRRVYAVNEGAMIRNIFPVVTIALASVACSAGRDDGPGVGATTTPPIEDTGPATDTGPAPPADLDSGFSPDGALPAIDADHDGYVRDDDCDDGDPLVNPGAIEVVGDHVD